jgi:hypothetical protein
LVTLNKQKENERESEERKSERVGFVLTLSARKEESGYSSFSLFIYSYVHTLLGPFLPLPPTPSLFLSPTLLPGRIRSAVFSNFVEEST